MVIIMSPAKALLILLAVLNAVSACGSHQLSLNGTCVECASSCAECAGSPSACTACPEQFYLANSSCLSCNASCVACSGSLSCSSCAAGFRLSSSQCLPCGSNCAHCSEVACLVCSSGYDLKSNCGNCAAEYYWNSTDRQCVWCGLGCKNCNSSTLCLGCTQKYKNLNGTCFYMGSSGSDGQSFPAEGNQQEKTLIIMAASFGGLFLAALIAYIVYRACFHQSRKKVGAKGVMSDSVGDLGLSKSDSIVLELSNKGICLVCHKELPETTFSCDHHFHAGCLADREDCPLCALNIKEAPVFLDDILGEPEISSEASSEAPRQDAYRYEESSNNGSVSMEMPRIDIQQ